MIMGMTQMFSFGGSTAWQTIEDMFFLITIIGMASIDI